ncbi:GNAT family N-acetyltransferase [Nocardia miyunensis]|uniref:GNAT family N-acetyltransferase n=1 Tax=Nocardia miyunensis TaxID=282684 RepID=UPI000B0C7EFC|nr:GNAT family N-acetyltransferase [Nocardia miyunensis]
MTTVSYETMRLVAAPVAACDIDDVAELLMDPGLYGYIDGKPASIDDARARVQRWIEGSPHRETLWINHVARARDSRELIGVAQATVQLSGQAAVECLLAYQIAPQRHRQGFGKEMMSAFRSELVRQLAPESFVAHIAPGHSASERVALSLGLVVTDREVDGERVWSNV